METSFEQGNLTFVRIAEGQFTTGTKKAGNKTAIGNKITNFITKSLKGRETEYKGKEIFEIQAMEADGQHVLSLTGLNALKFLQYCQIGRPITLKTWQSPGKSDPDQLYSFLNVTGADKREDFEIMHSEETGAVDWQESILTYLTSGGASDLMKHYKTAGTQAAYEEEEDEDIAKFKELKSLAKNTSHLDDYEGDMSTGFSGSLDTDEDEDDELA